MYIGLQLEGHTLNATDTYYFDEVDIAETPLDITTAEGSGADTYVQEALPTDGLATLMFASPNGFTYFATKENTNGFAPPVLAVTVGPSLATALVVL